MTMLEQIQREVRASGLDQRDIAQRIGQSPSNLNRKLNGRARMFVEDAEAIAAVLGCEATFAKPGDSDRVIAAAVRAIVEGGR